MNSPLPLSRREFLRIGGATLVLSNWVDRAEAAEGEFEFVVINDTHYVDQDCAPWQAKVVAGIRRSAPEAVLCLHAGDISDDGSVQACAIMRDIYAHVGCPFHAVPGNHDHISDSDRSGYDAAFPGKLNYAFDHGSWQFVALDTTEGSQASATNVSATTLAWLDEQITKLDPKKPTFVFTHFPMGEGVDMRPLNADDVIARLSRLNVRWVHCGHWHGESVHPVGTATLTTSRCCARLRGNRDGSPLKGWHIYRAAADGTLSRKFISFEG